MDCPHCGVAIHVAWTETRIRYFDAQIPRKIGCAKCPACSNWIIVYQKTDSANLDYQIIEPRGASRGPVPSEVPEEIAIDYIEACDVLPISAKASAALSRRCLQNMLRANGYKSDNLAKQIDLLLAETNSQKSIPSSLRTIVDGIRHFGNFSAHPITDITGLQIIEVEPEEAEWCLEVLEACFDHFYVRPAVAARRKAALDAKLAQAGKPPSKS